MLELADLHDKCETVCEIGPGSGRFAEEIIAALSPGRYEIYETARDWLPRLSQLPNAVIQECDGHTLSGTADGSVDLVHAQKVFVYLEFYATAGYLEEMARVVRPGGAVAFDIVTEDCLDDATVREWVRKASFYRPVPRAWAVEFMRRRGLTLRGSHFSAAAARNRGAARLPPRLKGSWRSVRPQILRCSGPRSSVRRASGSAGTWEEHRGQFRELTLDERLLRRVALGDRLP